MGEKTYRAACLSANFVFDQPAAPLADFGIIKLELYYVW